MNDKEIDKEGILSRWKSELNENQIEKILEIVRMCGMDFYTTDLEPNYARLYGDNPVRINP